MRPTLFALVLICALAACNKEESAPKRQPTPESSKIHSAQPAPAGTAPAAATVLSPSPIDAGASHRPRPEPPAEVEITGTVRSPARTKKFVAFVGTEPCDPKLGSSKALRMVSIDPNVSMNFFLEIFVPQGSTGHVCAAGYDQRDQLVLFGAYKGNPMTFRGKGEVTFSGVVVPLEPMRATKGR